MSRVLTNPVVRLLFLLGILGLLILSVWEGTALKERISNVVFDTYITLKPRDPSDKLVFVDIDDLSLSKAGQWPWPRTYIAQVVRNIKEEGAAVIVFDGVLAEPDRTSPENIIPLLEEGNPAREALSSRESHDAVLARAIGDVGNFVAGFSYGSNPNPPQIKSGIRVKSDIKNFLLGQTGTGSIHFGTTAQFLPELQKNAAGNGSFMASAEQDAVIRRTGLVFHDGKALYPSLILETLRLYEEGGKELVQISDKEKYNNFKIDEAIVVEVGKYKIPLDAAGKMLVYYREFSGAESISAYEFLDQHYMRDDNKRLEGKIVFIASSAEGLNDLRATPLGMQPGVKVHMNALEQILQGKFLIRPFVANMLEVGAAIAVCLLIIVLSFFVNPLWLAAIAVVSSFGAFWASWYLFTEKGGLLDPVAPAIMVVFVFIASSILSFLKTEFERKQVRAAFGLYISPDFMKELTK
ncbi:MAG TPA: hypothetical protein DEA55_04595, partial [Rhodospirillaceae bacterium]|nr:hypothetical protein [Rhodospirillaceae bacterium]